MVVVLFCFWPWCSIAVVNIKTLKMLSYISRWLLVAGLTRTLVSPRWGRMTTWTALMRVAEEGGRRCFFSSSLIFDQLCPFWRWATPRRRRRRVQPASLPPCSRWWTTFSPSSAWLSRTPSRRRSQFHTKKVSSCLFSQQKVQRIGIWSYLFTHSTEQCIAEWCTCTMYNVQCTMYIQPGSIL